VQNIKEWPSHCCPTPKHVETSASNTQIGLAKPLEARRVAYYRVGTPLAVVA
jgi:hypothetical protein